MDITFDHGNNSWKFHDDTMMGTWWKRCDRQTDGRNQSYSCLVAAKNCTQQYFQSILNDQWIKWFDLIKAGPGGCFTNVSRALQNIPTKICNARNHIYGENFKLKLYCTCTQSMALGTYTKLQLEILIKKNMISAIHKFRDNILESLRNVSETPPWSHWMVTMPSDMIVVFSTQNY